MVSLPRWRRKMLSASCLRWLGWVALISTPTSFLWLPGSANRKGERKKQMSKLYTQDQVSSLDTSKSCSCLCRYEINEWMKFPATFPFPLSHARSDNKYHIIIVLLGRLKPCGRCLLRGRGAETGFYTVAQASLQPMTSLLSQWLEFKDYRHKLSPPFYRKEI